jgi:F0F1-type ATP synthase alpha subunit
MLGSIYESNLSSLYHVGPRIALRGKVNESIISGLRIVDCVLPIGRGQRQLILGDRNTGKSTIVLCTLLNNNKNNYLGTVDGFGCKRLFGVYLGININISKVKRIIEILCLSFKNNKDVNNNTLIDNLNDNINMSFLDLEIINKQSIND